jgi:signal transduction histidine kinase
MNWLRSFRWRVLLGTFLWTLGLIPLLHLLFLWTHRQMRLMPRNGVVIFIAFGAVCILTGVWQFRAGLLPFRRLQQQLAGLREGSARRVEGRYPTEVQPLVNDLNSLLEHRERIVQRALAKAGDLAHGLKTPLAILAQEAERAAGVGHQEMASAIGLQVERMRRQIEYHLAQARATGSSNVPGARSPVLASVDALVRTVQRLYADRGLAVAIEVSPDHFVRVQKEDLEEMLGNLLDNACKWAKSGLKIQSAQDHDAIILTVDDDGPGLPVSMREAVLQRGIRADEAAPGSGLGLAIVRDLAELYGGSITLADSPLGGLRARLRLRA